MVLFPFFAFDIFEKLVLLQIILIPEFLWRELHHELIFGPKDIKGPLHDDKKVILVIAIEVEDISLFALLIVNELKHLHIEIITKKVAVLLEELHLLQELAEHIDFILRPFLFVEDNDYLLHVVLTVETGISLPCFKRRPLARSLLGCALVWSDILHQINYIVFKKSQNH